MTEWSQLPRELLGEIISHLNSSPIDILRFRSVCSTWREAASFDCCQRQNRNSVISSFTNNGMYSVFHNLLLSKRSIFLLSPPFDSQIEFSNSSCSWVIKIEEKSPRTFHLLYPLSRTQIMPLPPTFPKVMDLSRIQIRELSHEYFIHPLDDTSCGEYVNLNMDKIAFILREGNHFLLLTIHVSGKLVMYSSTDQKWRFINEFQSPYDDLVAFDGEFYAVDNTGQAVVIGLDLAKLETLTVVAKPICGGDKKRLVQVGGDLMLVDIYMGLPPQDQHQDRDFFTLTNSHNFIMPKSMWFRIFRLDKSGRNWVELQSLGDYILFLGVNSSFSACALHLSWHRRNCINFTLPNNFFPFREHEDGDVLKDHGCGVFSFDDGTISHSELFWPPPAWINYFF